MDMKDIKVLEVIISKGIIATKKIIRHIHKEKIN